MLRTTSFGIGLSALGFSTALHVALLLAPVGHPGGASPVASDEPVSVEMTLETEPVPDVPAPDAPLTYVEPAAMRPVPVTQSALPPSPVRLHPALAHSAPTVEAAPAALAASADDTPRFTIAIGTGDGDTHGLVSASSTATSHPDDAAPVPESLVDERARLVRGVAPAYPDAARADGVEGDVRLELVVDASGLIESARVVHGVGDGVDEAALRAAHQFRFAPAMKAGHPVRVRMDWSIQFRLQ